MTSQSIEMEVTPPSTATTAVDDKASPLVVVTSTAEVPSKRISYVQPARPASAMVTTSSRLSYAKYRPGVDPAPPNRDLTPQPTNRLSVDELARRGSNPRFTLEKIINGDLCPPANLENFMNWLIVHEHSGEDLMFLLCVDAYTKRFHEEDSNLLKWAPAWPESDQQEAFRFVDKEKARFLKALNRSKSVAQSSRAGARQGVFDGSDGSVASLEEAYDLVTRGPCREDLAQIVFTYCMSNSLRAINVTDRDRKHLLRGLEYTTHPSVFDNFVAQAKDNLGKSKLSKFRKFCTTHQNAHPARRHFAQGLGIVMFGLGLLSLITLTSGPFNNHFRWLSLLLLIPGTITAYLGFRGMCVVLFALGHYQLPPWEMCGNGVNEEERFNIMTEFFGPMIKAEDLPWFERYAAASWVRKVFSKEGKIKSKDSIVLTRQFRALKYAILVSLIWIPVVAIIVCAANQKPRHSFY